MKHPGKVSKKAGARRVVSESVYVFFLLLIFTASCKQEEPLFVSCNRPTSDIATVESLLVGTWSWAYERYSDRYSQSTIIRTPQSEGLTRRYRFFGNKDVEVYVNSELEATVAYELTTLDKVTGSEMDKERVVLLFKDKSTGQRTDFAPVQICSDTLTLHYQAFSDTRGQEKWSKK